MRLWLFLFALLLPGAANAATPCANVAPIARTPATGSPFVVDNHGVTRMDAQTSDNVRITGGCIDVNALYVNGAAVADLNPTGTVGDGVTDDSSAIDTACTAAAAAGRPLYLPSSYRMSVDRTLACDLAFGTNGKLLPDAGVTITHSGRVRAEDTQWVFAGDGTVTSSAPYRSVMWWGSGKSGSTDDAPGFRAALASNTYIKVPPLSYTFTSTETAPCCAFDVIGVHVTGKDNFVIDAYGAKLTMDNANALASWIHISSSSNFQLRGMECVGNRAGLAAGNENSCFTLSNVVNFAVKDIYASGNWGGLGTISAGDWMVNGLIENIRGDAVGQCFDYAFLKDVTIRTVRAKGADTNGGQGAGQVGSKCFSNIYDGPNSANNTTGVSFTDTDGVSLDDIDASNFNTGWLLASGANYNLTASNHWHDMPGLGGSKGIGGYIVYFAGGSFPSTGNPPRKITDRSRYSNNGSAVAGAGVYLDPNAIVNGDVISDIDIDGTFDNNADTGVNTTTASHLSNIKITGTFTGASQTTAVSSLLPAVSGALISGLNVTPRYRLANNTALVARNAANSADFDLLKLDGSNNLSLVPTGGLIYTGGTVRAGGVLAAAVDYVQLSPGATGVGSSIGCFSGVSTNVACHFYTQGTGNHNFYSGSGIEAAFIAGRAGLYLPGSSSGNALYAATSTGGAILKTNGITIGSSDASGNFTFNNTLNGAVGLAATGTVSTRGATGAPTSGSGGELSWTGSATSLKSYNRTGAAYLPLTLEGSSLVAALNGGNMTITGGGTLTSLPAPSGSSDAVTKAYADSISAGIVTHAAVAAATTANLNATHAGTGVGATLTNAGAMAAFAVDGYSASVNDRILVKDMTTTQYNGIYTVTTVGSGAVNWVLTRATDFDQATAAEVAAGASVIVINGTANARTNWVETGQGPFTVDTTPIIFSSVLGGSASGTVNAGTTSQLGYYAANGTTISGLTTGNNGVLKTDGSGVPSISSTLPNAVQDNITRLGTIATGVWNGTSISKTFGGTGADLSSTGGAGQVLRQDSLGGAITVGALSCADLGDDSPSCSTDTTNASNISSGTLAAARGGAGTISGALKGNGAGSVSQAACADLSDDGTACAANTGVSGHAVPFLDGTNTASGVNTFSNTTDASSATTGAVIVSGGVGVAKSIYTTGAVASLGGSLRTTGSAPSVASCGTSPSVTGTNVAGRITIGGGTVTACTLNFTASFWASAPSCVFTLIGATLASTRITSISSSSMVMAISASGNTGINYVCVGI